MKDHAVGHGDLWPTHRSHHGVNEDTPRLREFARIVNESLDQGVQLSYVEIMRVMGHPNLHSVARYGPGSRYTKLRQRIYKERGITVDRRRRTPQQTLVRELKLGGQF